MKGELILVSVAFISGMILRLVYKSLECFREIVKHRMIFVGIEDLIFWCGTAIYMFVQNYYTSDGSVRWYFVLGVVLGAAVCSAILRCIFQSGKKNLH